jgi:uncharacterized membrane protein YbaN (DUF454 family)
MSWIAPRRRSPLPAITCSADAVSIYAPEIFCASAHALQSFAARIFALGDVSELDVDLTRGEGTIRFVNGVDLALCLNRLAERLRDATLATADEMAAWQIFPGVEKIHVSRRRNVVSSWQITQESDSLGGLPATVGPWQRVTYLSLAGASFGMAAVGVAVPGIPTVPFLLVCSYFLLRSSPTLHEKLLDSRIFGPLLRDWHTHRAMRCRAKVVAVVTLVIVVAISILLAGLALPMALLVLLLALVGVWMIWRVPTIGQIVHEG